MLNSIGETFERFLGRGSAAVSVPAMDGPLKPNQALDAASALGTFPAADNLAALPGAFVFSSGTGLFRVEGTNVDSLRLLAEFDREVIAVATSDAGAMAVALDRGGVRIVGGPHDGRLLGSAASERLDCVVAMMFLDEDTLLVCNGSSVNYAPSWQRDLLEGKATGTVFRIDLASGNGTALASGLGYPYGLARAGVHSIVVAESWKSRLVRVDLDGSGVHEVVLDRLPGYPARISSRHHGGHWLAVFAPRSQLIEFVRREPTYCRAMMAEVPPEYWVAPSLFSGRSFHEPMQGGALRQMGLLKPWAPTRSYGLVIALDLDFQPVTSLHCRAGGKRHGITSVLDVSGRVLTACKGGDELLAFDDGEGL